MPPVAAAAAACALSLLTSTASGSGLDVVQSLPFFALSDWGGQSTAPFTTPGQLSAAAALNRLSNSVRPKLVLSAGGNFLSTGLPGASPGAWLALSQNWRIPLPRVPTNGSKHHSEAATPRAYCQHLSSVD